MLMKFRAVELKHLDDETIRQIRVWRNQPFVRCKCYNQNEISKEEHEIYIDKVRNDPNRGLFVFYLDEQPIGIYQFSVNPEENSLMTGNYMIHEEYQTLGYGTIATYHFMEIGWNLIKVEAIYSEVLAFNKQVVSLNKKFCGRMKDILKNHVIIDGNCYDVYAFEFRKEDWNEKREKIGSLVYSFVKREPIETIVLL